MGPLPYASEATRLNRDRGERKVREGLVVNDKMDKTVVVAVEDRLKHPRTARSCAAARNG